MSERKEFGEFGKLKPTVRRRNPVSMLVLFLSIAVALVLFAPPAWRHVYKIYKTAVEHESPQIDFMNVPAGVGVAGAEIEIKISDSLSGLDQVAVSVIQARKTHELLKKNYSRAQAKDSLRLRIDPQALGLREGSLDLLVRVFDKSLWSNSARKETRLIVDYRAPDIQLLSGQHNVLEGGVELVFYRLLSDPNVFSGVLVDSMIYPGFPAITLDESFTSQPDVYFAFFALPYGAGSDSTVKVIARDEVSNTSSVSVPFRVLKRQSSSVNLNLSRDEFIRMVDQSYERYLDLTAQLEGRKADEFYPTVSDEELRERFSILLKEYRELVENESRQLFSRPKRERFWKGRFGRPGGGAFSARFGWRLNWNLDGELLGSSRAEELWLRQATGKDIRATNTGKVIFAGVFGTYGKSVVVDHGFGLTTLYTHLESVLVAEGDEVRKGEVLGLSGSSGLIPFSGSGYQLRLHGVPIRPEEWWDEKWLQAHVEKKIVRVLRDLGVVQQRPLAEFGEAS